jgi:hypothetical protein
VYRKQYIRTGSLTQAMIALIYKASNGNQVKGKGKTEEKDNKRKSSQI